MSHSCGGCGGGCGEAVPAAVVTDIVVAHEREAPAVAAEAAPRARWSGIDAKGVDQLKLATLWALLAGREFRLESIGQFVPLHEVSEDGPWVFRLPDDLARQLADLEDARASTVAAGWAETDELVLEGWEPGDARALLDGLRGLARTARAAATPLLMWVSV